MRKNLGGGLGTRPDASGISAEPTVMTGVFFFGQDHSVTGSYWTLVAVNLQLALIGVTTPWTTWWLPFTSHAGICSGGGEGGGGGGGGGGGELGNEASGTN